ncbi:MAG: DEAD/DEAH box helicase [Chlamydiales bacterium]|nr:DEAD/DEAH box helicase [Chlamydiales bacterium]
MTFQTFDLDPLILDALRELGYENATPIQEHAIPFVIEGRDLIALAETGSGKTAACAIPVCNKVDPNQKHIQALIVVPTRELALQYATETQKIGRFKKVKAFALFGGEDMDLQRAKLKGGVQVLIATPGRLIDFVFSRAIDLSKVETLVLDEADQMLGMGFYEDLEFIINCLIQNHQTLLFSATMPKQIREIAKNHMVDPKELTLISKKPTPAKLKHQLTYCSHPGKKREELVSLLKMLNPTQCLIFANSRREVEALYRDLKSKLASVDFLHGGLDQSIRSIITNKFQRGKIRFLVATDIAARGLDFSNVTHVVNFHFPLDQETYTHRSGRTGRSGREGVCVTLVTKRDMNKVEKLFRMLKRNPEWLKSPN